MIESLAEWTGYDPTLIIIVLVVFAFLILRWGWRNPWGLLRAAIVVALLGGAAYAAFQLTRSGTSAKKAMVEDKVEDDVDH
jgi:hypothetical protein